MKTKFTPLVVLFMILLLPFYLFAFEGKEDPEPELVSDTISSESQFVKIEYPHSGNYTIFQDSDGYIWIGTQKGVYRYDNEEVRLFKGIALKLVHEISEDIETGQLTFYSENGTASILPKEEKNNFVFEAKNVKKKSPVISVDIRPKGGLELRRKHNINSSHWIEDTDKQRIIFALDNGNILAVPLDSASVQPNLFWELSSKKEIRQLFLDRSGAIFVLTPRELWLLKDRELKSLESSFEGERVWEIEESFTSPSKAMSISIKNDSSYFRVIDLNPTEKGKVISLKGKYKTLIEIDEKTFLAGLGNKLQIKQKGSNYFLPLKTNLHVDEAIDDIKEVPDSKGYFITSSGKKGLSIVKLNESITDSLVFEPLQHELLDSLKRPYEIKNIKGNEFLVTWLSGGVTKVILENENGVPSIKDIKRIKSAGDEVITIVKDSIRENCWWVGGFSEGLYLIDIEKDSIVDKYTWKEGLLSEIIYSIAVINKDVWFYTSEGLGCLLKENKTNKRRMFFMGTHDGLPHLDGTGTAKAFISVRNKNKVIFGTENGIVEFNPNELKKELLEREKEILDQKRERQNKITSNVDIWLNGRLKKFGKDTCIIDTSTFLEIRLTSKNYLYRDISSYKIEIARGSIIDTIINIDSGDRVNMSNFIKSEGMYEITLRTREFTGWSKNSESKKIIIKVEDSSPKINAFAINKKVFLTLVIGLIFLSFLLRLLWLRKENSNLGKGIKAQTGIVKVLINEIVKQAPSRKEASRLFYKILNTHGGLIGDGDIFGLAIKESENEYRLAQYWEDNEWKEGKLHPLLGTTIGYALRYGESINIEDVGKVEDWSLYEMKEPSYEGREPSSLLILPISDKSGVFAAVTIQCSKPRKYTNDELEFFNLIIESQLISRSSFKYPGVYFAEQVKLFKENWRIEFPNSEPAHIGRETQNRPRYYAALDRLFEWDSQITDEKFNLRSKNGYSEDHPINKMFKGLMLDDEKCPLSCVILILAAAFDRNKGGSDFRNPFLDIWMEYADGMRVEYLRYNNMVSNGSTLENTIQCIYNFGKILFFHRDEKRGVNYSNISNISYSSGALQYSISLKDLNKLIDNYDLISNKIRMEGADAAQALYKLKNSISANCLNISWPEKLVLSFNG